MKKRLIIAFAFLLFASPLWAFEVIHGPVMVATVSATCTSCTPGDPADVLCEDCENSDAFWCSWSEDIDAGNTVSCENHSGTLACTDKGSKAINVSISGSNGLSACKYKDVTAVNSVYVNGYFNLVSTANWDAWESIDILRVYNVTNSRILCVLYISYTGTEYKLSMRVTTTVGDDSVTGPAISLNTWYRVGLSYTKNTTNGASLWVSGTEYPADDGETTYDNTVTRQYIGSQDWGSIGASETAVYQWDCVEIDDDTMPGACPE
jgi:hypothetical protein